MTRRTSVLILLAFAVQGPPVQASEDVPGGWSTEVGVFSFDLGLTGIVDPGRAWLTRPARYSFSAPVNNVWGFSDQPQVIHQFRPLVETVRRSSRRRSGR
jgi:hypothetical protein